VETATGSGLLRRGTGKCVDELLGSIKCEEFIDYLTTG
jgi:hypothetical protein